MVQADKDLLLKDLCARLPYGVNMATGCGRGLLTSIRINDFDVKLVINTDPTLIRTFSVNEVKPYLFPLDKISGDMWSEYLATCVGGNASFPTLKSFEWCNEHHIDYRGLIPKGLAIDATGLNIY